jgi:hypothetical protein
MTKIFEYISFAIEVGESVTAVTALIAAKQPLTGAELQGAINPAISGIQAVFGVTPPAALVSDICQAAADAINKYVLKTA